MKLIMPALNILKSKYVIAALAFVVWMLFFDQHDWRLMKGKANKLKELKSSEKMLSGKINDTKKELSLLNTDIASLEKYARENFYMKKDNEDLFIVKKP